MPADRPKVVVDANVIVRAAANPLGAAADLLASVGRGELAAVCSTAIVQEYTSLGARRSVARLLARRAGSAARLAELVRTLLAVTEVVEPTGDPPPCRDENDRMYLHCAEAASSDYLVTFDEDLLEMDSIQSARIVTPAILLALLRGKQ